MRLAEAGRGRRRRELPQRDSTCSRSTDRDPDQVPLHRIEADLAEADGLRVELQTRARSQLRAEAQPVTRATVLRASAHQLLRRHQRDHAVAI